MTNRLALMVAVILGVLSIVGIKTYVDRLQEEYRSTIDPIPVLVAAHDIPEGQLFTDDDVLVENFDRQFLSKALRGSWVKETERPSITGARTRTRVLAGQVLQHVHFHSLGGTQKKVEFSKDQRAITIPANPVTAVAGMLKPGDYIDIIVSMDLVEPSGKKLPVTRTLFKNVIILATDQTTSPFEITGKSYQTITVRLPPEDCNKLAHCLSQGGMLHYALVQEGTSPKAGYAPTTNDDLYKEISPELQRNR